MSLEKDEEDLKKVMEENNLEWCIRHLRYFDKFVDVEIQGRKYTGIRAITVVAIVDSGTDSHSMEELIDVDDVNFVLEAREDVDWLHEVGIAMCSKEDEFHTQKGRMIAGGRALKKMGLW